MQPTDNHVMFSPINQAALDVPADITQLPFSDFQHQMLPPSGYGNFIENHQNGLSNGSHPFELNY